MPRNAHHLKRRKALGHAMKEVLTPHTLVGAYRYFIANYIPFWVEIDVLERNRKLIVDLRYKSTKYAILSELIVGKD